MIRIWESSNLSTHEQFNLNILINSDNWGEHQSISHDLKPKTSKYSESFSKHSVLSNL